MKDFGDYEKWLESTGRVSEFSKNASDSAIEAFKRTGDGVITKEQSEAVFSISLSTSTQITLDLLNAYHEWLSQQSHQQ